MRQRSASSRFAVIIGGLAVAMVVIASTYLATRVSSSFALIAVVKAELTSPSEVVLIEEERSDGLADTSGLRGEVLDGVDFSSSVVALVQVGVSSGLLFCDRIELVDVTRAADRPHELQVHLQRSPWPRACNDDLLPRVAVLEVDHSLLQSISVLAAYQDDRLVAVSR